MTQSYRLSKLADAAIVDIVAYTDASFGDLQTQAYLAGLKASFELICQFPGIGVAAFEIKPTWRRYRYQSHYLFYSQQPDHILIEAIVHTRRNIRTDLFDT
ncbi:MAG: type II toxin-antitoxin system RelE/ParE family toxin [Hyphomicrobiaceae bacterium]|nr:type II toxin-antitoxin system RelE/ParE family toxin [Hyphomicrobiaceae bacterium]